MNSNKNLEELKEQFNHTQIPKELVERMEDARKKAGKERVEEEMKNKKRNAKYAVMAAAVVLAVFTGTVNFNPSFAQSLQDIPLLGSIVKVITIDKIAEKDQYLDANIDVAGVKGNEEANKILRQEADKAYAAAKDKAAFVKEAVGRSGATEFIPANVTQTYEVISCMNGVLSVKITTLEIQASGYETLKGINIDLVTNKVISLKDQFKNGADYVSIISGNVKKQMKEKMKKEENSIYFIGKDEMEPFTQIKPDQTYFIDENGNLIIAFDEYEVAPGYMGTQLFTIDGNAIKDIRR